MRRVVSALLALLGCGRVAFDPLTPLTDAKLSAGGPTVVQSQSAMSTTSSMLTVSLPNVAAGDMLVAAVILYDDTQNVTSLVDDSSVDTFVSAGARSASPDAATEFWYAVNEAAGPISITAMLGASPGGAMWIVDVAGLDTTAPVDTTAVGHGAVMAMEAGPGVVTAQADDLVLSVVNVSGGDATAVASPFVTLPATGGDDIAYALAVAPGTYAPQWTMDGGGTSCGSTVAFRDGP